MLEKIKEKLGIKKQEPAQETEKPQDEQKPVENAEEVVDETKESEEIKQEEQPEQQPTEEPVGDEPQVTDAEPVGNGMRIEDLVTKDEFADRIASLEAKLDAIIKENADLKDQNSQLKDKYEEKDFGVETKKGVLDKDKSTEYSSYDEYSKNYM